MPAERSAVRAVVSDGLTVRVAPSIRSRFEQATLSVRSSAASADQLNPLQSVRTLVLDGRVRSVRDAVLEVIEPSGYTLLDQGPNTSRLIDGLLDGPLPDVHREFTSLSTTEMLRALAGPGYVVVVDHVHRRLTFDPMPRLLPIGVVPDADGAEAPPLVSAPVPMSGSPEEGQHEWIAVRGSLPPPAMGASDETFGALVQRRLATLAAHDRAAVAERAR